MTAPSIRSVRIPKLGLLFSSVLELAVVGFVSQSAPALADRQCALPGFSATEVERAPCPSTPSGSYCLYWKSAEGTFTPTYFSVHDGALAIEGTFSGVAYAFAEFVYTLVDEPVWFFVGDVEITRASVAIRGERTEYGPYVPSAEVQYTTALYFDVVDENGPGVSVVDVEPLTLLASPSNASIAQAFRRAGDDPAKQAEILNRRLFGLRP